MALDACRVAGAAAAACELAPSGRDALRRLDRFAAMAAEHRGDRA